MGMMKENARLLCVYMRPWTLNPADATEQTPLLSRLGMVQQDAPETKRSNKHTDSVHNHAKSNESLTHAGSAPSQKDVHSTAVSGNTKAEHMNGNTRTRNYDQTTPRTRITQKAHKANSDKATEVRSYARAWMKYIDGNVVSRMNQRFITNLLTATAARVVEEPADSSEDSDEFHYDHLGELAGSMDLIQQTLDGINARDKDNGVEAIGRHAKVIQLGRNVWQSPPLSEAEARKVKEKVFESGHFPPKADVLKAAAEATKNEADRPAPFEGRTPASAKYSSIDYVKLMRDWFARLQGDREPPNTEQLAVLHAVRDRILQEVILSREGPNLRKRLRATHTADAREEPLRGLCHGYPGTGKSKVIKWIIRLFTEALEWTHGSEFLCVAFQNTVAYAMGGLTLHSAGDIQVGGESEARKLGHTDVDVLTTRNQALRWPLTNTLHGPGRRSLPTKSPSRDPRSPCPVPNQISIPRSPKQRSQTTIFRCWPKIQKKLF